MPALLVLVELPLCSPGLRRGPSRQVVWKFSILAESWSITCIARHQLPVMGPNQASRGESGSGKYNPLGLLLGLLHSCLFRAVLSWVILLPLPESFTLLCERGLNLKKLNEWAGSARPLKTGTAAAENLSSSSFFISPAPLCLANVCSSSSSPENMLKAIYKRRRHRRAPLSKQMKKFSIFYSIHPRIHLIYLILEIPFTSSLFFVSSILLSLPKQLPNAMNIFYLFYHTQNGRAKIKIKNKKKFSPHLALLSVLF